MGNEDPKSFQFLSLCFSTVVAKLPFRLVGKESREGEHGWNWETRCTPKDYEGHMYRYGRYSETAGSQAPCLASLILGVQGRQARSHLWLQQWSQPRARGRALYLLGIGRGLSCQCTFSSWEGKREPCFGWISSGKKGCDSWGFISVLALPGEDQQLDAWSQY